MRNGRLKLAGLIGLVLVMVISILASACTQPAPTTPAPGATKPAAQPAAQTFNWRLQSFGTPNDIPHKIKLQMADDLKKMTAGRLNITVYTAGQLVAATDVLQAVAQGTIEAGDTVGAYFTGAIPEANLEYGIPFTLQTDWEVAGLFWEKGWLDLVREAYGEKGVYYLAPRANGNFGLWGKKAVRTVADMQGLKVRAIGAVADMFKKVGASPVSVPLGEAYLALQTGTIDAMSTGQYVYQTLKHYEVVKFFMVPGVAPSLVGHFLINPRSWAALPDDIKAILSAYSVGHFYEYGRMEKSANAYTEAKVEKDWGGTVVTMSAELQAALKKAALEVLDDYGKANARSTKMATIYKDYMKELGYIK